MGGMRYRPGPSAAVQEHIRYAQSKSRMPLLVASNPEMGGAGSCDDGTFVSTHLQAGSHPDKAIARRMGQVAGVETAALGCNWAFAPIVDIHYNWRNTVISTRSFGNTPEIVVERAKEYFDGISESPTVCAMKHFPGDGVDERDQHVVTSYNTLGYEEWDRTYGHVYREMIGHGVQSIMVGHIGAPELSRHFRPGMADARHPARDAGAGTAAGPAPRRTRLQRADPHRRIADGGPHPGHEAQGPGPGHHRRRLRHVPVLPQPGGGLPVTCWTATSPASSPNSGCRMRCARILGLKASLGLHREARDELVPPAAALAVIGATRTVPLRRRSRTRPSPWSRTPPGTCRSPRNPSADPALRHFRRGRFHPRRSAGLPGNREGGARARRIRGGPVPRLRSSVRPRGDRRELHVRPGEEATGDYAEKYDAAFVFANVKGFAQEAAIRIKWSTPMAAEIPGTPPRCPRCSSRSTSPTT